MKFLVRLFLGLFVLGLTLSVVAFFMGLDIEAFRTYFNEDDQYELKTYTIENNFDVLSISADQRHIEFVLTDTNHVTFTYYERTSHDQFKILEESSELSFEHVNKLNIRSWFNFKYVSRERLTVTVEIPKTADYRVYVYSSVGNLHMTFDEIFAFREMEINSKTGSVNLTNITAESLVVELDTGSVVINQVEVAQNTSVETDTGNIRITDLKTKDLTTKSDTGNVTLTNIDVDNLDLSLSTGGVSISNSTVDQNLIINSSTGNVTVTSVLANDYDIRTRTGRVSMTFDDLDPYRLELSTSTGKITVLGTSQGNAYQKTNGSYRVKVVVNTGDIIIK